MYRLTNYIKYDIIKRTNLFSCIARKKLHIIIKIY